jgi:hypothetical protein
MLEALRCNFTDMALTEFKSGRRTIKSTNEKGTAVYDNIDIEHGTARIVASAADDLNVKWLADALWFIEKPPLGGLIVTTVFPNYSEGTEDFIVLESRHSVIGKYILGEQSSGTCSVLN